MVSHPDHPHYKWVALSNTTLGMLLATINSSIVLISLPAIFNGIQLDPLTPGNVSYLLWMLMGYMLVTAVLVVTLGRLGDMYGRVRIYNAGFADLHGHARSLLSLDPFTGGRGALWLIGWRVRPGDRRLDAAGQLGRRSSPTCSRPTQRGMALGINIVAGIAGSFIGLVLGGLLAEWNWRLDLLGQRAGRPASAPSGRTGRCTTPASAGTARIDWWGNATFALGLTALLAAHHLRHPAVRRAHHGLDQPVGAGRADRRRRPCWSRSAWSRSGWPSRCSRWACSATRAFTSGNAASLLGAIARGGLQFMLIIWLQGIWLPLHGYDYADTPLWAGIYLLPLTVGFLVAGPIAGRLSDRYGPRLVRRRPAWW